MSRISATLKHCRTDDNRGEKETGFTWATAPSALAFSKQQAQQATGAFPRGKDQGSGLFVYRYVHVNPKPWRSCAATESSSLLPPPPPVDKGGGGKKTPQKRRQGKEPGRQSGREVVASKASAGRSDKWAGSLLPRTPPRRTPRPPGPGLPEPAAPQAPREASRGTGS